MLISVLPHSEHDDVRVSSTAATVVPAVSVLFCQLVKLRKLSLSDCVDNAEGNDVKRGNSESLNPVSVCGVSPHLLTQAADSSNKLNRIVAKLLFLSIRLIFKACNLILLLLGLYIIFVYREGADR